MEYVAYDENISKTDEVSQNEAMTELNGIPHVSRSQTDPISPGTNSV